MNFLIKNMILGMVLLCYFTSFSQTRTIDSIKKIIATQTDKQQQLNAIFALCEENNSLHPDSLHIYINKAALLATNDKEANALLQYYTIVYLSKTGKADSASILLEKTLATIDKDKQKEMYRRLLFYKSRLYIRNNQQKEGIDICLQLLQMSEKDGDILNQKKTVAQLGWAYMELGQNREALNWFYKRVTIKGVQEPKGSLSSVYGNMAAVYNELHQNDSAEFFVLKAIAIAQKEEGLVYLANAYYIYSDICIDKGNVAKAEQLLVDGLAIRKQIGDVFYVVSDITQLALFYAKTNQPQKGIAVSKEGITLAQSNKLTAKLPILYDALAQNYKAANDLTSYSATLNQIIALKDSLYTKNSAEALGEMQTKYELQKKETEIAQQKLSLLQRKLLLYGAAIMATALILFALYRFKKYQQQQKTKLTAILDAEKKQNELTVKDAEEKERKRIAAELHDNLGVQANAILHNSTLLQQEQLSNQQVVDDLQETAKEMLLNLRETLWAMKATDVSATNLWLRIINFMQQMGRHYANLQFKVEGQAPQNFIIASNKALNIVLVLQETVNNAVKHSGATTITASCTTINDAWQITIQDDGKGFDIETAKTKTDSYGLQNMRERAITCNFTYTLNTAIGVGTKTTVGIQL
jgi:two-component system, NarL family, sensor kinase